MKDIIKAKNNGFISEENANELIESTHEKYGVEEISSPLLESVIESFIEGIYDYDDVVDVLTEAGETEKNVWKQSLNQLGNQYKLLASQIKKQRNSNDPLLIKNIRKCRTVLSSMTDVVQTVNNEPSVFNVTEHIIVSGGLVDKNTIIANYKNIKKIGSNDVNKDSAIKAIELAQNVLTDIETKIPNSQNIK